MFYYLLVIDSTRCNLSFYRSEVDGSDDEFDSGNDRTCSCAIM